MSAQGYYRALMNRNQNAFPFVYDVEPFQYGLSFARKLKSDYSGNSFQVERSSDSTNQDIGFSDNLLDESALTTFVGANNGNIITGYDQAENGDWTESDAGKKPLIVSSGTVQKISSFPSANFNADNHRLKHVVSTNPQPYSLVMVFQQTTTGLSGNRRFISTTGAGSAYFQLYASNSSGNVVASAGSTQQLYAENTNYNLISIVVNSTSSVVKLNGTTIFTGNLGTFSTPGFNIGRWYLNATGVLSPYFKLNELLVYSSDISSSLSSIELNVNDFYSIY